MGMVPYGWYHVVGTMSKSVNLKRITEGSNPLAANKSTELGANSRGALGSPSSGRKIGQ